MPDDLNDPRTWHDATIVVRGGTRDVAHLQDVMARDGSWSVVAGPGMGPEERDPVPLSRRWRGT